ncbi:hypothetical protein KBG31_01860 [Patescibacteria group bacterium]|nr:hypothetical protein [Patescibacteria group bacterium]HOM78134.1 hypothetical protein [bacterium]
MDRLKNKNSTKTTLLILLPLVALVDIAAIMSLWQGLHPDSNAEVIFLILSFFFFVFSGYVLLKKEKTNNIVEDPLKEVDEEAAIQPGRF